jgi:hypothetical protein
MAQWSEFRLPADAAASFPAIHTALLERAAEDQGLAQSSVLMRADLVSAVRPPRLIRGWEATEAQRRALGLAADTVKGHVIARLLLRLAPADRPAVLELQGVPWQTAERVDQLSALQAWPETLASCRRKLPAASGEELQRRFDAIAERQRQAWRWVEQMTGRSAPSWQPR